MTRVEKWHRSLEGPVKTVAVLLVGILLAMFAQQPALADGEGESDEAAVLVLQAIGILTNEPSAMDDISDKVHDALEAPHKEGVDLAQVREAEEALDNDDMAAARSLLQQALQVTPTGPVTGEATGTTVVHGALDPRGRLASGDWGLLAISVLVLAIGAWLAVRFRPAESVRVLRRQLSTEPRSPASSPPGGSP